MHDELTTTPISVPLCHWEGGDGESGIKLSLGSMEEWRKGAFIFEVTFLYFVLI